MQASATRRPGRPNTDGSAGIDRGALEKAMMATTWPEWSLKTRCRYGSEDDYARFTGYPYKQLEAAMIDSMRKAQAQQPDFNDINELKASSVAIFEQHYAHLLDGGPKRRTSGEARPAAYDQAMHTVLKHLFAKLRYASIRGTHNVKQASALPATECEKAKKLIVVLKTTPSTSPSPMLPVTRAVPSYDARQSVSAPRASFNDTSDPVFEPAIPRRASQRLLARTLTPSMMAPAMSTPATECQAYIPEVQAPLPAVTRLGNMMIITSFLLTGESVDLVVQCDSISWHLNAARASRLCNFFRQECQKQPTHGIRKIDMSMHTPVVVHAILQFIFETDHEFSDDPNDILHVPQELHADCHFDIAEVAYKYDNSYQLYRVAERKFVDAVEAMGERASIADLINKVFQERSSDVMKAAVAKHCLKHVVYYTHNQAFWKVYTGNSGFAIKFLQAVSAKEERDAERNVMTEEMEQCGGSLE